MKESGKLFTNDRYKEIEREVKQFLNSRQSFISGVSSDSTRAVGDAVQSVLEDGFEGILGPSFTDYTVDFPRRAMADLAFSDETGLYYVVDVKTHRLDTRFNMPNLTSVQRLARFYEDDNNYFVILMVNYDMRKTDIVVENVHFVPIEFLSWDCLTLGALGWGQIQIANANNIIVEPDTRQKWMLELCDKLGRFYDQEIIKIGKRKEYFRGLRSFWENEKDF